MGSGQGRRERKGIQQERVEGELGLGKVGCRKWRKSGVKERKERWREQVNR